VSADSKLPTCAKCGSAKLRAVRGSFYCDCGHYWPSDYAQKLCDSKLPLEPEHAAGGTRIWCSVCEAFDTTIHVHYGDSHGVPLASPEPEPQCSTCDGHGGMYGAATCPECEEPEPDCPPGCEDCIDVGCPHVEPEPAVVEGSYMMLQEDLEVQRLRHEIREIWDAWNKTSAALATEREQHADLRWCKCGQPWKPAAGFWGTTEEAVCHACTLRGMLEKARAERDEARRERDDYLNELSIVLKRAEKSDAQRLLHQNGYEDEVVRCNRLLEKVTSLEAEVEQLRELDVERRKRIKVLHDGAEIARLEQSNRDLRAEVEQLQFTIRCKDNSYNDAYEEMVGYRSRADKSEGALAHERERRKKAEAALAEARRVAIDAWDRSGPQQGYADEMANTEAAIKRYRVRVAAQLEQQPPAEETDDE